MATLSVVICTRNRPDTVGQAVDSVARCTHRAFDIHVMDQSTDDRTQVIVQQLANTHLDRCAIVHHHLSRAGLSAAYNSGIAVATGEIIACTDDDVIVPEDWLVQIEQAFDRHRDADLLYGQVCIPAELEADVASGVIVPALTFEKEERLSLREGFKVFGMGANMAIRRSLLDRVGGFDEALGGGGPLRSSQDFDFAYRTWRFGGVILLAPGVKVDHYGTRTADQWPETLRNYGIGDGAFYGKHIRCGDVKATWLFARAVARSRAYEVKQLLTQGRWAPDAYGRHLLVGFRAGRPFGIDRRFRLYRESARAKMTVTDANSVTSAVRK
ncbi:MAG: glycosyltransferase family A protein [Gemmatimonadota bacterium]